MFSLALTVLLACCLFEAFRIAHLPLRFSWRTYLETYWLSLAAKSIFVAAAMYSVTSPPQQTILPLAHRYRRSPLRLCLACAILAALVWIFGPIRGAVLAIDALVIEEFVARSGGRVKLQQSLADVIVPAAYFFFGFILVMSYNDVIAALRFDGSYDLALNRVDSRILLGHSVIGIAHATLPHLPHAVSFLIQWIYALMFPLVGVCILFLGLGKGMRPALEFVGTLLTAYYLSLAIFYLIPAAGPFFLDKTHSIVLPGIPMSHSVTASLEAFASHMRPTVIGLDYFIGFPSLHAAIPVIAIWYLREFRRITLLIGVYCVVLVPAILLLEEHYVIDLIGGVAIAFIAIAITGRFAGKSPQPANSQVQSPACCGFSL